MLNGELWYYQVDSKELANAMKELGVIDHRFLGGPGKFRDSGMMGTPPNERKDSFWLGYK